MSLTTHYRLNHYGKYQDKKTKEFKQTDEGKCPLCHKNFGSEDKMRKHFHTVHTEKHKEKYKCDKCGKKLANKRSYNQHVNSNTCVKASKMGYLGGLGVSQVRGSEENGAEEIVAKAVLYG